MMLKEEWKEVFSNKGNVIMYLAMVVIMLFALLKMKGNV